MMDTLKPRIMLSPEVKHLTQVACYAISGYIQTGLVLTSNLSADIVIYKDRIDFGTCLDVNFDGIQGSLGPVLPFFQNYYKEGRNIVYRYDSGFNYSMFSKTLDYVGVYAPTEPDNAELFHLLYPKFS